MAVTLTLVACYKSVKSAFVSHVRVVRDSASYRA
jgi:hypothetical protein